MEDEKDSKLEARFSKIRSTTDYSKFRTLPGNRKKDEQHVKQIMAHMQKTGNLTAEFPIVVNEKLEIIDGQHRLEALKRLEWPVGYEIHKGLSLQTTRDINAVGHNWTWKDYAQSYSDSGNQEYKWLLYIAEKFNQGFRVLMPFCGYENMSGSRNTAYNSYKAGEFAPKDHEIVETYLEQCQELENAVLIYDREFCLATLNIMKHANYDQDIMLKRIAIKKKTTERGFERMVSTADYMRMLEDIYNYNITKEARRRLF